MVKILKKNWDENLKLVWPHMMENLLRSLNDGIRPEKPCTLKSNCQYALQWLSVLTHRVSFVEGD